MSDSQNGLVSFAVLALVVFLVVGASTRWSFGGDRLYLGISCPAYLDDNHRCATGGWSPVERLHVRINRTAQSVLIFPDGSDPEAGSQLLKNCAIIDDDNWKCDSEAADNGRYYSVNTVTIGDYNLPSPVANSSLGGWPYFLYRVGVDSLEKAMEEDGFPPNAGPAQANSAASAPVPQPPTQAAPSESAANPQPASPNAASSNADQTAPASSYLPVSGQDAVPDSAASQ
jgi:hypothetical protein